MHTCFPACTGGIGREGERERWGEGEKRGEEEEKRGERGRRERETSVHRNTYNVTPRMSHFLSHSRGDESVYVRSREAADLI